jgi:hypothetical protein
MKKLKIINPNLIFALSFWLLSSFYHLKFSLFLVNPLFTPWGKIVLKDYSNLVLLSGLVIILGSLIFLYQKSGAKKMFLLSWLLLFAAIIIINLYFMATPIENIHFFQYAIICYFILSAFKQLKLGFLLSKSLFIVTVLGVIDEFMQYFYITRSYSNYLDFNDFWLNMLGAIAGLLFFLSLSPIAKDKFKVKAVILSKELWFFVISILTSISVIYINNISIERKANSFSHWNPDFFSGTFYVLSPIEGMSILFITSLVFMPFFVSFKTND